MLGSRSAARTLPGKGFCLDHATQTCPLPLNDFKDQLRSTHLGTGEEIVPFVIDWQDSDATICWLEQVLECCPRGKIVLWIDQAPHHTSEEVEEWLEAHRRLRVIHFPAYTPEENPKEATWKTLKEEVSHHHWHE